MGASHVAKAGDGVCGAQSGSDEYEGDHEAAAGPGSLTVQWNPADHPGARGLLVSYGESLENMAVRRVTFAAGNVPEALVIDGLTPRTRHFVHVNAWDGAGNLSTPTPVREIWTS